MEAAAEERKKQRGRLRVFTQRHGGGGAAPGPGSAPAPRFGWTAGGSGRSWVPVRRIAGFLFVLAALDLLLCGAQLQFVRAKLRLRHALNKTWSGLVRAV